MSNPAATMTTRRRFIRSMLDDLGLPRVDARSVEAWLLVGYPTLDHLGLREYERAVLNAAVCVREADPWTTDKLADSFGL